MTTLDRGAELNRALVTDLLNLEARLLDENRLYEWLDLLTHDVVYWVPMDPTGSPTDDLSLVYEDRFNLEARVWRIIEAAGVNHSQDPPSRTVRAVSNIELELADPSEPTVHFVTTLFEVRPRGQRRPEPMRILPMRCEYRLRQESSQWRISYRRTTLLQAEMDLGPMTFMV